MISPETEVDYALALPERPASRTIPAFYNPALSVSVRKQKRLHEQTITSKLFEKRQEKKREHAALQAEAKRLARKVPVDILAKEWLNTNIDTIDVRSYLVEKCLPAVVMALEKLLMEVDQLGLPTRKEKSKTIKGEEVENDDVEEKPADTGSDALDPTFDANFNPINYVARYLMRNNPKYNNLSEMSPYSRGLREVSDQLKKEVFSSAESRLAQIKLDARRKREAREKLERDRNREKERKTRILKEHFAEWISKDEEKVPKAFVQNAMKSFQEFVANLPPPLRDNAQFATELVSADSTSKMLFQYTFVEYLLGLVENFTSDAFDTLIDHMRLCAAAYHESKQKDRRRKIYADLFRILDPGLSGKINRKTILKLMVKYWFKIGAEKRQHFRDPRKWPIVEIEETEESGIEPPIEPEPEVEWTGEDLAAQDETEKDGIPKPKEETAKVDIPEVKKSIPEDKKLDSPVTQVIEPTASVEVQELPKTEEDGAVEASQLEPLSLEGEGNEESEETEETLGEDEVDEEEAEEEAQSVREQIDVLEELKKEEGKKEATDTRLSLSCEVTSHFEQSHLSPSQFMTLIENFIRPSMDDRLLYGFISYMRDYYIESEYDKLDRLVSINSEADNLFNRYIVEQLFEYWDSDGRRYLDLDEVIGVAEKFKDGIEQDAIDKGLEELSEVEDNKLFLAEFIHFCQAATKAMSGSAPLEEFVKYLRSSVEKSYEEKMRGIARRKWIDAIYLAAETGGGAMDGVYTAVFSALYKDAETHGRNKKICANICLLEPNRTDMEEKGDAILRCVASTVEDASFMLGFSLFKNDKNVSFAAVNNREPLHVPQVNSHGHVHFWNTNGKKPKEGSLVVCPLLNYKRQVFGTLAIDSVRTLNKENNIFLGHEIAFYQGVAQAFSQAFTLIEVKNRSLTIVESSASWIHSNCPSVRELVFYLVERQGSSRDSDYILRKMMISDPGSGKMVACRNPKVCTRGDNVFKEYLFKAIDNSEATIATCYGDIHVACPLRDAEKYARALLDINTGDDPSKMTILEKREMYRILEVQEAALQLLSNDAKVKTPKTPMLNIEEGLPEMDSASMFFEKVMLLEMRKKVAKLKAVQCFSEVKSYQQPPAPVEKLVDILILIFLPEKQDQLDIWRTKKMVLSKDLLNNICAFDPTAPHKLNTTELRKKHKEIPQESLAQYGPFPAEYLYEWLVITLSLMEQSAKLRSR